MTKFISYTARLVVLYINSMSTLEFSSIQAEWAVRTNAHALQGPFDVIWLQLSTQFKNKASSTWQSKMNPQTLRSWKAWALIFLFSSRRSITSLYPQPTSCERRLFHYKDNFHTKMLEQQHTFTVQYLRPGFSLSTLNASGTTIRFFLS